MRDRDDRHLGPPDQLIRAFHRMLGRQARSELPAPPDPITSIPDTSPPSPDEQAYAKAAAREAMRRIRRPS